MLVNRHAPDDWLALGRDLARRGLPGRWPVVSDGAPGWSGPSRSGGRKRSGVAARCTACGIASRSRPGGATCSRTSRASWAALAAATDPADAGRTLCAGLVLEIVEALYARGFLRPGATPDNWHKQGGVGFGPEGLKLLLDELCAAAGVEVCYLTRAIDVDTTDRRVNGVVLHDVRGYRYIKARAFIDATGAAFLADAAGAACREAGRDTPDIMPGTLCSAPSGIDWSRADKSLQQELVFRAIAGGFFSQPDRHVPGLFRTGRTTAILNAGHLFGMSATDAASLSAMYVRGRQLAREYNDFFRTYMPGCEDVELVATAALVGVREPRRVVGEYELGYADFQARRHFPDQIGVYRKAVDIHVYDCSDEQWARYRDEFKRRDLPGPGESYGMLYGILVPQGWTNLWVAGRCNSSDIKVNGAIRDQPGCMLMGQAAGTAAVQSLRTGQAANELDTRALVQTLREHGAYLPQPELSPAMTRSRRWRARRPEPRTPSPRTATRVTTRARGSGAQARCCAARYTPLSEWDNGPKRSPCR